MKCKHKSEESNIRIAKLLGSNYKENVLNLTKNEGTKCTKNNDVSYKHFITKN